MGIKKKFRSISKKGITPIIEGKRNYEAEIPEVEQLARKRLETCRGCLKDEPISFFRVKDTKIPELSEKMCGECECAAPYLFRQSIDKCEKWIE